MKTIIILLSLLSSIIAQSFFPDANSTNAFKLTKNYNKNSVKTFISYDNNGSISKKITPEEFQKTFDQLGTVRLNKDVNWSSPTSTHGYVESLKPTLATDGRAMANTLRSKSSNYDTGDVKSLTSVSIKNNNDQNSTEVKAIKSVDDFYKRVRSKMANRKYIECYVTRKLVNSYYCPLPSLSNSFFKGGNFKDSKSSAKKECEGLCFEQSNCLSKDMNKQLEKIDQYPNGIKVKESAISTIITDPGMQIDFIEYEFTVKYRNNEENGDLNNTVLLKKLKDEDFQFKFDSSYKITESGVLQKYLTKRTMGLKEKNIKFKIYPGLIKSKSFSINFFEPYNMIGVNQKIIDNKLSVILTKTRVKYIDNKFWFCPALQFKEDVADCKGNLKNVTISGTIYKVCVSSKNTTSEPIYGAFFTEKQCLNNCKLNAECIPTYRHLTSFDPLNLPPELKDIEIGCNDTPTNTSCTVKVCEQLFKNDVMPITENTWINDDSIKQTVANGIQKEGLVRPRIDIADGLLANGSEEKRMKASLGEMAEISYANMIEMDTYDVTEKNIGSGIEKKNGYLLLPNGSTKSLTWQLKPESKLVDDGKNYHVYSVSVIESTFRPMYGSYKVKGGEVQSGSTDSNIAVIDKTYLLKTANSYKIVKRIQNNLGKFGRTETLTGSSLTPIEQITYTWGPMDAYKIESFETFYSNEFLRYDKNDKAESFVTMEFKSDKKYETFFIYSSLEDIVKTDGVLFGTQVSSRGGGSFTRDYMALPDALKGSRVSNIHNYGFYSERELTYAEVVKMTDNKSNLYYSSSVQTNKKIKPDNAYSNKKIDFYISGDSSKTSINADFKPDSNEEGKKTFIYMLLYEEEVTNGNN